MLKFGDWALPGAATLIVGGALAFFVKVAPITDDLTARATAALVGAGQEWAVVELNGRDATVSGLAPSPADQAIAVETVDGVFGVRAVADGSDVMPEVSPYTFGLTRDGDSVTLSGSVPSIAVRDGLLTRLAQAVPGVTINDGTAFARGAPDGFSDLTDFAVGQLSGFDSATISLKDTALSVEGIATDLAAFEAASAAFGGALPAGATLASEEIEAPVVSPYTWNAERTADTILLTGFVPDDEVRAAILTAAQASADGRTVVDQMQIAGGAPDGFADTGIAALQRLGQRVSGRASLTDADLSIEADEVVPYVWSAERTSGNIVLSGYVPSEEARAIVMDQARQAAGDLPVIDRMALGSGLSDDIDFDVVTQFALQRLTGMATGMAQLTGDALTVSATAADTAAYGVAVNLDDTAPPGISVAEADIALPRVDPYTLAISRTPTEIVLDGYVPDDETRAGLVEAANSRSIGETVVDRLQLASGAPRNLSGAVNSAIQIVSRLDGGVARLEGASLSVTGEALHAAAKAQIDQTVSAGLPAGFVGSGDISVKPAPPPAAVDECGVLITSALETNRVQFEVGSADIRPDSFGLLDTLVFLLARCPDAAFRIDGHTDSDGSDELNQRLSEARAGSVLAYLTEAGAGTARFVACGLGETQPLASNTTDENKAFNRRIEFVIAEAEAASCPAVAE
ncbi:MAG: OmpA family protein [Pseudomonadota bacterium]